MLRRKLLARIGLLIGAFVIGAAVAIVLLQGVVRDVDRFNAESALLTGGIQDLSAAITTVEALHFGPSGRPAGPGERARALRALDAARRRLAEHPIVRAPGGAGAALFERISGRLDAFTERIGNASGAAHDPAAMELSVSLRDDVRELGRIISEHVGSERRQLAQYFRLLVLGLTLAAILMVNVSVVALLRMAHMILRPVDQLVAGSRELARERFDHRVVVDRDDEFGELAHAYNHLAEELAANEQRKMETLRQVAVTLNHGLNNAISGIELQLRLVDRQAGADPELHRRLERIRESLARIADAVHALSHLRRIVLTEYMPGQLMLDLQKSVEDDPSAEPTTPKPAGASSVGHSA